MAVEVWLARADEVQKTVFDEIDGWLLAEERQRRRQFVREDLRREYTLTRGLARHALSRVFPRVRPPAWQFARTTAGRPFVVGAIGQATPAGGWPDFNLSNTPSLVVCAVSSSRSRVGIDVEREDRGDSVLEVAATCFSDEERASLGSLDPIAQRRRAVELWALKESYVKALGVGLGARLRAITFVEVAGQWRVRGDDRYAFALTHHAGHALAVSSPDVPAGMQSILLHDAWPGNAAGDTTGVLG